jgi:hypothetical protein
VRRRDRFGVTALGQHRGTLVLGHWRGRFGESSRVLLKRPGDSHFTTIAKRHRARRIDVDEGFVMHLDKRGQEVPAVWVVDLRGARPRTRQIAISTDNDCRCANALVKVRDATLDRQHVYWIEEVTRAEGDAPLGAGAPSSTTTRILRVDLRDPAAAAEGHVVGSAKTLAVASGLVFHDAREEFTTGYRPEWAPAEPFLPVEP